ncbi:MAG: DUF5666 domain-containing protein [Candidatus Jorgensenbacteria bacterium]|nr:DUF5666 domain-containing protein [Candidatus Jorgensenbacteria bacterium]
MEKEIKNSKHKFGTCGMACGSVWCTAVKWLILVVAFAIVFVLGMINGAVRTANYYELDTLTNAGTGLRYGMMNGYGAERGGFGMMRGYKDDTRSLEKVFGSITNITGNTISILDNGGNTVSIFSSANTAIFSGQSETSINSLVVGQDASVFGTRDLDGRMRAQYIYTK